MDTSQLLLALGGILLAGQILSTLGKNTYLPRVSILLIFGVVIGKNGLALIPANVYQYFDIVAEITLLMVGFLIGGKLAKDIPANAAAKVVVISLSAAVFAIAAVALGLFFLGLPVAVCIIVGAIASATDPAATLDTVMESNDQSPFAKILVSIVALDDAWALMLFGICVAIAGLFAGNGLDSTLALNALRDIFGAILLGLILGLLAANLTGRLKPGEPMLSEAMGLVLVCGGLSIWLDVSFLITAMTMGAVVALNAKHHDYPFHEIENIEWPFMVIFFVLAGASLELSMLESLGLTGLIYIVCRMFGKFLGALIGGHAVNAEKSVSVWTGVALMPQAGVAIGMALVASHKFPEYGDLLLQLAISTTIFFEIVGPIFTRIALLKASSQG